MARVVPTHPDCEECYGTGQTLGPDGFTNACVTCTNLMFQWETITMTTNSKHCKNCRSFSAVESEPVGYCHRRPPSFYVNREGMPSSSFVPVHHQRGWCDEFEANAAPRKRGAK